MAEQTDIKSALEGRLLTLADRPETVWPGEADTGVRPRLEVTIFRNDPVPYYGFYRVQGIFQVAVVTNIGQLEWDALAMAERVAAHFPRNQPDLLAAGIVINLPPTIAGGFNDQNGAEYRLPVSIPFRAYVKET